MTEIKWRFGNVTLGGTTWHMILGYQLTGILNTSITVIVSSTMRHNVLGLGGIACLSSFRG